MKRMTASLMLSGFGLCFAIGCTSMLDSREAMTIAAFTAALEDADMDKLREASSGDFQEVVLRREDALDALKQLNIPVGETKVVKIDDVDDDTKRVLVEVGEEKDKKKKLIFTLTRDAETRHWVVDDIHAKKRLKGGQVNLSVQEQMDMQMSIREFLDAWSEGNREKVMGTVTAPLAEHLGKLPPACLTKLTKTVAGQKSNRANLRPEGGGHKDAALVRIPRKTGEIVLSLRKVEGEWKADDVQVISKHEKDNMPSLRKLTSVMIAAIAFYDAYQAADKEALRGVCTKELYGNSLSAADLTTIKLPDVPIRAGEFETNMQKARAIVMLKHDGGIVQLSLAQDLPKDDNGESPESDTDDNLSMAPYQVEDVTLCELDTKQEKRLSALFTAQAIMKIFSEALSNRDLVTLRHTASVDMDKRILKRLTPDKLAKLPLDHIEPVPPVIEEIVFKGPITEIVVMQGKHPMTYVLRDQSGKMVVDDVEFPALDRPKSLKTTLDVMLPIYELAAALQGGQIGSLKSVASHDFNKAVWNQFETMPELPPSSAQQLATPLARLELANNQALVVLGDNRWGAKLFMVKEGEQYVVDDVMLINGVEPQMRLAMKQYLRGKLLKVTASKAGTLPVERKPPVAVQPDADPFVNERPAPLSQ